MNNTSVFYNMHPSVILIYFFGVFSFTFIYNNPVFMIFLLISSVSLAIFFKGSKIVMNSIKMSLKLGLFIIIINALTNHRGSNVLIYMGYKAITFEAIFYGIISTIMITIMLISFISFNALIDSERFLFLFGKFTPKTAFITSMTLRFTAVFKKRAVEIMNVQETKKHTPKSFMQKIKYYGKLLEALTSFCMEEGMMIAQVLKAKNYGIFKRTSYNRYKFTSFDLYMNILLAMTIIFAYITSFFDVGKYEIYPRISHLVFNKIDIITMIIMLCFVFSPLILEFFSYVQRRRHDKI